MAEVQRLIDDPPPDMESKLIEVRGEGAAVTAAVNAVRAGWLDHVTEEATLQ
jgi:hypothetical protein